MRRLWLFHNVILQVDQRMELFMGSVTCEGVWGVCHNSSQWKEICTKARMIYLLAISPSGKSAQVFVSWKKEKHWCLKPGIEKHESRKGKWYSLVASRELQVRRCIYWVINCIANILLEPPAQEIGQLPFWDQRYSQDGSLCAVIVRMSLSSPSFLSLFLSFFPSLFLSPPPVFLLFSLWAQEAGSATRQDWRP